MAVTTSQYVGFGLVLVGFVCLGYALTVDVFAPIPRFTFDSDLFRVGLFTFGLLTFAIGLSLSTNPAHQEGTGT